MTDVSVQRSCLPGPVSVRSITIQTKGLTCRQTKKSFLPRDVGKPHDSKSSSVLRCYPNNEASDRFTGPRHWAGREDSVFAVMAGDEYGP